MFEAACNGILQDSSRRVSRSAVKEALNSPFRGKYNSSHHVESWKLLYARFDGEDPSTSHIKLTIQHANAILAQTPLNASWLLALQFSS